MLFCIDRRDHIMKFHEYRTLWEEVRGTLPRQVTEETFYAVSLAGGARTGNGLIVAEGVWKKCRRPYYQVWPAVVPALLHLRLNLDASLIHTPMPALVVRLPVDPPIPKLPGVQTALMQQDGVGGDLRLWVNFMRPTGLANMHITLGCEPGKTLEQSFQESAANTQNYIVSGNFHRELPHDRQYRRGRGKSTGINTAAARAARRNKAESAASLCRRCVQRRPAQL